MSCCDPVCAICLILLTRLDPALEGCTAGNNPSISMTQIHVTLTHLSQPSSKLSQLFINMKLCLSQVEQCDFLLRRTAIVWPLSRATVTPLPISPLTHIVQESISLLIVCRALICPNPETICNTEDWDK